MAEFSKEYIECENWDVPYDFSIQGELNKLSEGDHVGIICEGFGFTRIHRDANQCLLWFPRVSQALGDKYGGMHLIRF